MSDLLTGRIAGLELPVSRLFFGTAIPPVSTDEPAAPDLLDSVLQAGVNAFDCARSYGRAEEVLGRWMESRGCRDRVTVLTKCGDIRDGVVQINRQVILDQLARSLEALRTEQIDIYLLHRDDPNTPVEEYIDTLNELKAAGKFRIFGVSNWTRARIEKANRYAESRGLAGFSVSSPNFGLTRQMRDLWGGGCVTLSGQEHAEDRAWYADNQMPVIAYSSLGRGFFSGKFRAGDWEGARQALDSYAQAGYLYPENMERLKRAEELAEKKGCSVAEIAMRYVFSTEMKVFAVVSTTKPERMAESIRAAANPLTESERDALEA
jgi:aryl-alcohol dehydrogenase-like predicted oxidoreductase